MSEKLKGSVTYGRTVNTGNYSSKHITMSREYYLDEEPIEYVLGELKAEVDKAIAQ